MAKSKRGFSPSDLPEKQDDYHGGCQYARTTPDLPSKDVKSVNIELMFEESLRLATAIQSAVQRLNRYDRSKREGKMMGLCLSLKVKGTAISVIEVQVEPPK